MDEEQCPSNWTLPQVSNIAPSHSPFYTFLVILLSNLTFGFTVVAICKTYEMFRNFNRKKDQSETDSSSISTDKEHSSSSRDDYVYRPYISFSCGPVFCTEQRKKATDLDIEELQELAGDTYNFEQENVLDYCYGGYKPIKIGEELGDRYKVIRKLGFGHFSTVWLCQDMNKDRIMDYVAVKVVKSAPSFTTVANDEIELLKSITTNNPEHEGCKKVIHMLNYFKAPSIYGTHICITFELMGPSLLHLIIQSDFKGIQLPAVRSITKQILQGIVYLHECCKIIHTDLKPENILIKIKDTYIHNLVDMMNRFEELGVQKPRNYVTAESWEDVECFETDSDTFQNLETFPRANSFPKDKSDCVQIDPMALKDPIWVSPNIEVKIADLGNACWEDKHFSTKIQTKQYRALEVLLGADYSFPADIWSIGCIAFELATGEYLFNPKDTAHYSSQADHVLLIFELLGGIPNYIAQRGLYSRRFFDNSGNLKMLRGEKMRVWKTEDVLVDKYKWKRVDAIPFADLLQAMVEPDPELRITASLALQSEWINEEFL